MSIVRWACALAVGGVLCASGCSTAPESAEGRSVLHLTVQSAVEVARQTDPGLQRFFDSSAGYAVFPSVGKGAIWVGGAFGRGQVFEKGRLIGYCSLTQANIGLAFGGQSYTEFIFFETTAALDRFKWENYTISAQISAVALKSGASANAKYADGVAVFTMSEAGLMFEAAIGGQKFSFQPI